MLSTMRTQYSDAGRTERLIAGARAVLAVFFLIAVWLDPTEPARFAAAVRGILAGYAVYALLSAACIWRLKQVGSRVRFTTHGIDLTVFTTLLFLTEGPSSRFFVYFIFLLVCAALRWQWQGTLWTAGCVLGLTAFMALDPFTVFSDATSQLNHFVIRVAYLAVVTALLGYLGAHEAGHRSVLSRLAAWRPSVPTDAPEAAREILARAVELLGVPRALLVWEEEDEPWVHLAVWMDGEAVYRREHPSFFEPFRSGPFADGNFLCLDAGAARPMVTTDAPDRRAEWRPTAAQRKLLDRYPAGSLLSLRLRGDGFSGFLLGLDGPGASVDDLLLGNVVAQQAEVRLENLYLAMRLRRTAASEERILLARDLHDGILQTMTGAALRLETVRRTMETDLEGARRSIGEICRMISDGQQELRSQIRLLKPALPDQPAEEFILAPRLAGLAGQIRLQWGLQVEIETPTPELRVDSVMGRNIYYVIHEALVNAAKHAGATLLRASISLEEDRALISVADNGRGFPFLGFYDNDRLFTMKRGPVNLKERLAALGGTISIDSSGSGARLEITVPLNSPGARNDHPPDSRGRPSPHPGRP